MASNMERRESTFALAYVVLGDVNSGEMEVHECAEDVGTGGDHPMRKKSQQTKPNGNKQDTRYIPRDETGNGGKQQGLQSQVTKNDAVEFPELSQSVGTFDAEIERDRARARTTLQEDGGTLSRTRHVES